MLIPNLEHTLVVN